MLRSAWELIRASGGKEADGTDKFQVVGATSLGMLPIDLLDEVIS